MPIVTDIAPQKRNANRRNIHLDGRFAFGCNLNVVARFRLRPGMQLSEAQVRQIKLGEVKQECFDAAMSLLQRRLHSRSELQRKLSRREWGGDVIDAVLDDLSRLGYVDDDRFARTRAMAAAEHKHHGRRRAYLDLLRSGVRPDVADRALTDVYADTDTLALARQVAQRHAARLRKLEPQVARRRLAGLLQRRGFDYEDVKTVIQQVLEGSSM